MGTAQFDRRDDRQEMGKRSTVSTITILHRMEEEKLEKKIAGMKTERKNRREKRTKRGDPPSIRVHRDNGCKFAVSHKGSLRPPTTRTTTSRQSEVPQARHVNGSIPFHVSMERDPFPWKRGPMDRKGGRCGRGSAGLGV